MSGSILVRGARQLITLRGAAEARRGAALNELGIIRDGALLIMDGCIAQVGLSRRIENMGLAHGVQEIDATGQVVMPGFVDCHAHLIWGGPQEGSGSASSASADLEPYAPAPSVQALCNTSAKTLEGRARQMIHALARHGTTSLEAKSGWGLDPRSEIKMLRVALMLNRAPLDITATFLTPRGAPPAEAGDPAGYLRGIYSELLPGIRRKTHTRFAGVRYGGEDFSMDLCRLYLETARDLGFQLKIHAGQGAENDAINLALAVGAATVEHLTCAGAEELGMLARSNTMAVLLPGASFLGGGGGCRPARQFIDSGGAVALGSNFNAGASSTYSMLTVIALACAHWGMSPAEALTAATFNAACACGLEKTAGSFEVGKPADLIVLNAADYREIPYHFGVNLVNRTIKRGVTIYQEAKTGR